MGAPGAPADRRRPEAQFQGLVEHSLVGMAIVQDDRFLYVNPKYCETFGYGRDELLERMSPLDLVADADRALAASNMEKRLSGAAPGAAYIFKGRRKDGTIIDVNIQEAVMEIGGRPALIASLADVTDRRRDAEKIGGDEAQFRALVEQGVAGVFIIQDDQTVSYLNRRFAELIGYSHEQVLGHPLMDFIADADKPRVASAAQSLISGKTESVQIEAAIKRKDGGLVELLAHGAMAGYRGRPAIFGFAMDITERKRAEESLRESQRIIEGILNTIPVRVFWKDKNLVYLGCNAAFARDAGFADPKDIVGKDDYQMGWRDQVELYRGDDRQVIESGRSKILIEEPQTTSDGKTITLLTSKIPLRGSGGEVDGVLGVYMDITEYKRAEEAQRLSEEKYRGLFEVTRDAIMTLDPPYWKFASGNPAALKMYGASNEKEFVSYGPWELSPERQPDGRMSAKKAMAMIETAMREGSNMFEWMPRRIAKVRERMHPGQCTLL
jgi:PAS domain S-box-containing protein